MTGQGPDTPVFPCSLCGGQLELSRRVEPGSPYPCRCPSPSCGGECTGWFAADGGEYCDRNDDCNGKPPWYPDYEGTPPPRCEWAVKPWSEVPIPETPLCPGCAVRLTVWQPPAGYVVAAIEHEPGCGELWELLRVRMRLAGEEP